MSTSRSWIAVVLLLGSGFLCNLITARAQSTRVTSLGRSLPGLDPGKLAVGDSPCESIWGTEPILMYDCSGGTLLGSVHEGLILYSNGLAIRTKKDVADLRGTVEFKELSSGSVRALWDELMAAGAASMCDDPVYVSDMPLTKVTVFAPADIDAVAHTYAYYLAPAGAASFVELVIRSFIETEFEGD